MSLIQPTEAKALNGRRNRADGVVVVALEAIFASKKRATRPLMAGTVTT
jgi:hypothetical protein